MVPSTHLQSPATEVLVPRSSWKVEGQRSKMHSGSKTCPYSVGKRIECQLQQELALSPGEGTPLGMDGSDSVYLIVEPTETQSCPRLSRAWGWGLSFPFLMMLGFEPGASHMLDRTGTVPLSYIPALRSSSDIIQMFCSWT